MSVTFYVNLNLFFSRNFLTLIYYSSTNMRTTIISFSKVQWIYLWNLCFPLSVSQSPLSRSFHSSLDVWPVLVANCWILQVCWIFVEGWSSLPQDWSKSPSERNSSPQDYEQNPPIECSWLWDLFVTSQECHTSAPASGWSAQDDQTCWQCWCWWC